MEENNKYSENYKKKVIAMLRTHFQYVIIGSFVMSFLLVYGFTQFAEYYNIGNTSTKAPKEKIAQAPTIPNLQKKIQSDKITYITTLPDGSTELTPLKQEEQGQISAIATEQVTYTKNKYVVQLGDSLASIALQVYGDSNGWVRLAEVNNLASPDAIEVGMELIIPR